MIFGLIFLFLLGVLNAFPTLYIGKQMTWCGKQQHEMDQEDLRERYEFFQDVLSRENISCFNAEFLYGRGNENKSNPTKGIAVVCPMRAYEKICKRLVNVMWEQMLADVKRGVNLSEIVVVTPMRGGLPIMMMFANLIKQYAKEYNLEGFPIFVPTLQERRNTSEDVCGQVKVPLHQSLKGRYSAKVVYIADDIVKSGGTAADDLLNVLYQMENVSCVRIFTLFAAQKSKTRYKFSRIIPKDTTEVDLYEEAEPSKKFSQLFRVLKKRFKNKGELLITAWSAILIKGDKTFWLVSPFEVGMPEITLSGRKDYLGEMLQSAKCFAHFRKGVKYDDIVCIMVPAIGVFREEEVYGIYNRSFFISNESGDVLRYAPFDLTLSRIKKHFPRSLQTVPGTVCSPFVRIDAKSDRYIFEEGDILAGERVAVRTNLLIDVEVTPRNTLIVLPAPLGSAEKSKHDLRAMHRALKEKLMNYGYNIFDMTEQPSFYNILTIEKIPTYPVLFGEVDRNLYTQEQSFCLQN